MWDEITYPFLNFNGAVGLSSTRLILGSKYLVEIPPTTTTTTTTTTTNYRTCVPLKWFQFKLKDRTQTVKIGYIYTYKLKYGVPRAFVHPCAKVMALFIQALISMS